MNTDPMDREWDIFISYAHEDADWVNPNLYEKLLACRSESGARPTIFIDRGREGIPPGWVWEDYVAMALQRSRYIVVAYTRTYFAKPMCDWELRVAWKLHPKGGGRLLPIMLEPEAEEHVPAHVSDIHWLPVQGADWFERLCLSLGLAPDPSRPSLRFRSEVGGSTVRHTLSPVEVAIVDRDTAEPLPSTDSVTIAALPEGAALEGTLVVEAEGGVAVFGDLLFSAPAPEVRLVAEAPGCEPATSAAFAVVPPSGRGSGPAGPPPIAASGTPVFFPDGRVLAVLHDAGLSAFEDGGGKIAEADLGGPVRLWARGERLLAVAGWSGRLVVIDPLGSIRVVELASPPGSLAVVGAMCFVGDHLYVGMWNGTLWSLSPGASQPETQFEHPAGIQGLGTSAGRWFLAGLDGSLTVAPGDGEERQVLEPFLLGLRAWADCAVAVGERRSYRLSLSSGKLLAQEFPLGPATEALLDGALGVIVDDEGQGVRFDSELAVRGDFHAARGARPTGVDRDGRIVVFAYADGSHVLMENDRAAFSTTSGPLAVSPDGSRVALTEGGGIRILPLGALSPDAGPA